MEENKENKIKALQKLATYVPDGYKDDKKGFIDLVNKQVLGVDSRGASRSIQDLTFFLSVSKRTGLDPLARQIYAVYRWNSKTRQEEMSIQVSIDGFRLVAQRSGNYAGQDDIKFIYEEEFNPITGKVENVYRAECTVYKMINGVKCGVTASARWDEYVQKDKEGKIAFMWIKFPKLMLGKCAEALALRKAFPNELSGLYTEDEMAQATNPREDVNNLPKPEKSEKITTRVTYGEESGGPIDGEVVDDIPEPKKENVETTRGKKINTKEETEKVLENLKVKNDNK